MDREVLLGLLDEVPEEAFVACKDAIRAGADYVVWDDTVPADQLARTYSRRVQHMTKIGTPVLGGEDLIARLHISGDRPLRIGQAVVEDPPTHFQLFLSADGTRVVACLGIDQR